MFVWDLFCFGLVWVSMWQRAPYTSSFFENVLNFLSLFFAVCIHLGVFWNILWPVTPASFTSPYPQPLRSLLIEEAKGLETWQMLGGVTTYRQGYGRPVGQSSSELSRITSDCRSTVIPSLSRKWRLVTALTQGSCIKSHSIGTEITLFPYTLSRLFLFRMPDTKWMLCK